MRIYLTIILFILIFLIFVYGITKKPNQKKSIEYKRGYRVGTIISALILSSPFVIIILLLWGIK